MELFTEIIGYVAATFGTVLMLPQVIKSYKTHRVNDLSMVMVILYILNCIFWLIYGLLLQAWPVIICNTICIVIGFLQLVMKLKFEKQALN